MAQLTADERLVKVKTALYGTPASNYNDEQLQIYIDDIMDELISGGVKQEIAESTAAVGCFVIGLNDIWNYTSGGVKHSPQFDRRLIQLSKKGKGKSNDSASVQELHERIVLDVAASAVTFGLQYSKTSIVKVVVNGFALAAGDDYTLTENTIRFSAALIAGTEIDIYVYG